MQALSAIPLAGPTARIGISAKGYELIEMREENRDLARRAFETAAPHNKAQARTVLDRAESDLNAAHQQSDKLDEGLSEDLAMSVIPGPWGKAGAALKSAGQVLRGTGKAVVERVGGLFRKRPGV